MSVAWTTSESGFEVGHHVGAKLIVTGRNFFVYRETKIVAWGRGNDHEDAKRSARCCGRATDGAQDEYDRVMEGE